MSGADAQIRRRPELVFTRVDDDLLGVDTQTGLTYGLNSTASRVWELLEDWTTVDAICAQLQQEYEVEPGACVAHVQKLVAQLRDAELLEHRDGEAS